MRSLLIVLGAVVLALNTPGAWAVPDSKNIADGASKEQAVEGIMGASAGWGNGQDTTNGTAYLFQYYTDPDSSSTTSLLLSFEESVPGSGATTQVFAEFTGYTTNSIAVSITNDDPDYNDENPLTFSNVEYMISPTLIPLEDLNYELPPPLSAGFTALPSLDTTLAPGDTSSVADVSVPEPLTVVTLGMGFAGLGGYIRRRRMAAI